MDDIPRSVILILLVITVLVSVLGTWTVMDQLNSAKVPVHVQKAPKNSGSAYVQLKIENPNQPQPPASVSSGAGYVTLKIQPQEVNKNG